MNISHEGRNSVIHDGKNVFSFESTSNPREFDSYRTDNKSFDWTNSGDNYHLGEWRVFPYGNDDQLPNNLRDIVQQNYMAPGQLKKKTQWLWGKGPRLYSEELKDGDIVRNWEEDEEVTNWLESWDYEKYLTAACVDFNYIESVVTKFYRGLGGRIGKPSIAKLEHISPDRARKAAQLSSNSNKATHIVLTDWAFNSINSILNPKVYNIFDSKKPFKDKNSVYFSNMYSFCSDYYTVPDIYGSFEWLRRSTAIPQILKALSDNSMNIKYHVISPQKFWDDKKSEIEKSCTAKGVAYKDSMLLDFKENFLKTIAKVLSGAENTGKFWHSTKEFTVEGTNIIEHGWEIKEINQNVKDFITSQIDISKRSDHIISSAIGLGSVLGNVTEGGGGNSGSDRIYAIKEYLQTGIDIAEMIVMKAVNFAIAANWPEKKLKLGFLHKAPEKEQDVNPKKRIKNQE